MTSELIPTVSIEGLCAKRDATVARIREAHRLLMDVESEGADTRLNNGGFNRKATWSIHLEFSSRGGSFTSDNGVAKAIKKIDAGFWSYLLEQSGMGSFLDATARAAWREAIDKEDVPDLTPESVRATFQKLYAARGEMFERGVCELFRKLSWDYKTNSPVRFGKRMILEWAVSTSKWRNKQGRGCTSVHGISHTAADKLDDLVRVMSILDKKPEPDHRHATYSTLAEQGWMQRTKKGVYMPDDVPTLKATRVFDLFEIKGFLNGNAHVTFLRQDLVDELNRIVAKAFPNALPPGSETL